MKFDRAVAVYILNSENKVLMLLHKKLNVWLPPGGHVEDELIHEAARREVMEEAGLSIEFIYDTRHLDDEKDQRVSILPQPLFVQLENLGDHFHEDFVYLAKALYDDVDNRENHEIGWFSFNEALKLETYDNVKRQLKYISFNCESL